MTPSAVPATLPTHKDLPDRDGVPVINFQEHPQSALLTGCLDPRLRRLFPDGNFMAGADSGIYWRVTDPPLRGCKSPDWYLVIGVPQMLDGEIRRSYVMWQEFLSPLIVIEYVSGDGGEEHDRTPLEGKFWVYENGIKADYYAISDGFRGTLELYRRTGGRYHPVPANEAGRFPVPELGVELGLWHGTVERTTGWYVRPWDIETGEMLPSTEEAMEIQRERAEAAESLIDDIRTEAGEAAEQAEQARREAERANQRAEQADQRAARLAEKLRQLGIDPEAA